MNVIGNDQGLSLPVSFPLLARMPRQQRARAAISTRRVDERRMATMERVYQSKGGLACGDEVAFLLRKFLDQPISTLARWIVSRTVVSFPSQSRTLLPLFQFDRSDMSISADTVEITRELTSAFDDKELALWFAEPNCRLDGAAPVDAIARDQPLVLRAARADKAYALARRAGSVFTPLTALP